MTNRATLRLYLPLALALFLTALPAVSVSSQQAPAPAVMASGLPPVLNTHTRAESWPSQGRPGAALDNRTAPEAPRTPAGPSGLGDLQPETAPWRTYIPAVLKRHLQTEEPTPTATRTGQPTRTATPISTAPPTAAPTRTATPTTTGTVPHTTTPTTTSVPTATPTATATSTVAPSATPQSTATRTATPTSTATPTATPTPSATPTTTPTEPSGAWVNILSEDFEGTFPGEWDVFDNLAGHGVYQWGVRDCRSYSGVRSAWAVGGGAQGAMLPCYSDYPSNVESWMVYGPVSLADALQAEVDLAVWLNTEAVFDGLGIYASIDDQWYHEIGWAEGQWELWLTLSYGLSEVPELGSLAGQPEVWIALVFEADDSLAFAEGCYVDDIVLRKCVSAPCTSLSTSASRSDQRRAADAPVLKRRPQP